jgi:hypothetical protein
MLKVSISYLAGSEGTFGNVCRQFLLLPRVERCYWCLGEGKKRFNLLRCVEYPHLGKESPSLKCPGWEPLEYMSDTNNPVRGYSIPLSFKCLKFSQVQWYLPVIPALRGLRQEDRKFKPVWAA